MKCFLDMDEVLVNCVVGASKFYGFKYSYNDYPYEFVKWDVMPPPDMDITPEDFWKGLDEDFWANLDWTFDGQKILKFVEEVFGQENICILTTPTGAQCSTGKIRWITKNIPQYSEQYLIGPAKSFCASDKSVLIDDADHKIEAFQKSGGYGVLVPRPFNSSYRYRNQSFDVLYSRLSVLRNLENVWKT